MDKTRGLIVGASILLTFGLAACAVNQGADSQGHKAASRASVVSDPDARTKETLRTVVAAARTVFADSDSSYEGLTPKTLARIFGGVCYEDAYDQAGTCEQGSPIIQMTATPRYFAAAAISPSNECLWVKDDGLENTWYGSGWPCTGQAALDASSTDFPL
jgi:hypothetical protein